MLRLIIQFLTNFIQIVFDLLKVLFCTDRIRCAIAVGGLAIRPALPDRFFIDMNPILVDASKNQATHVTIANRQRLCLPIARRLIIPEPQKIVGFRVVFACDPSCFPCKSTCRDKRNSYCRSCDQSDPASKLPSQFLPPTFLHTDDFLCVFTPLFPSTSFKTSLSVHPPFSSCIPANSNPPSAQRTGMLHSRDKQKHLYC